MSRLLNRKTSFRQLTAYHVNRLFYTIRNSDEYNADGIDIFTQDWDNLLILDACRYDYFADQSDLDGTLSTRISRASATREWVGANFTDRQLHDVVYVSANPNYRKVADEIGAEVHAYIDVWRDDTLVGEENTIVPPETVTEHALSAAEEYPNKRLLVHYVQPHYPFIGPTGKEHFDPTATLKEVSAKYDLTDDRLDRAYRENLDFVLDEAERLLEKLHGKTVVSADHGELLGERLSPLPLRAYGHPNGVYVDELVEVPWLVHQNGERREIVSEEPVERDDTKDEALEEQLRNLGYMT
ncbi:hypothetical protein AMR74_13345 [Halorubrum tropicale]|uniref:Sulfatase N-terminal domain-containing protein n=1 Tax=Halorubrum tropicale TaxID=1765655 RepID=A0A0M9ARE1_9EURY|nr:hypothetical protein AMR74_13345 [Halorubrum tropicale]